MVTKIFIDGSYYIFYRYYATVQWWKFQGGTDEDAVMENEDFKRKFEELFEKKLLEVSKKLKVEGEYEMYIALDCPRDEIWRNDITTNYKATRVHNTNISSCFQYVMSKALFEKQFVKRILKMDRLEADDCIALSVKFMTRQFPDDDIFIITNDHDYLQLKSDKIHLINLKYQQVGEKKTTGNAEKDLFLKAVCGDKSDNISKIFIKTKVGPKTAEKYFGNEGAFKELCEKDDEGTYGRYKHNLKLISFDEIPELYQVAYAEQYYV